jgi:hypothetical protein
MNALVCSGRRVGFLNIKVAEEFNKNNLTALHMCIFTLCALKRNFHFSQLAFPTSCNLKLKDTFLLKCWSVRVYLTFSPER